MNARLRSVALVGSTFLALWGCDRYDATGVPEERTGRPNVILVSIDTLRAEHVGCYGYLKPTTPFLDSLAARGVRFEKAFAQSSWTLPSHMSLLTSRYPRSHRVQADDRVLPPRIVTLAQVLRRHSYATHGFVSWVYLSSKFGFDRGFDRYEELIPPEKMLDSETRHSIKAADFIQRVAQWAEDPPPEPFLLFLHLFDPHVNYEPPVDYARPFDPTIGDRPTEGSYLAIRPYIKGLTPDAQRIPPDKLRRVTALYDGEIRYTDEHLGRLFDLFEDRGLLRNAIVVVTSDHGEELDDHGSMEGHQWTLYDEIIHVPLVIVFPGERHSGETVSSIVQSIDVAPTLLSYLGVEIPEGFEGRDLMPLVRGDPPPPDAFTFSQTNRFTKKWAIRNERHKLIYTTDTGVNPFGQPVEAGYELYDLVTDPRERHNVYDPASPVVHGMMETLNRLVRDMKTQELQMKRPRLSEEEVERLRSLGYLDGD